MIEAEKYRKLVGIYQFEGEDYDAKVGITGGQETLHIRIPGEKDNLVICIGDSQEKIAQVLRAAQSLLKDK